MQAPIRIGKLGKPHGLKGEVRILADKEAFLDFLEEGQFILVRSLPYRILSLRDIGGLVLTLEGLESRSAIEAFRGQDVFLRFSEDLAQVAAAEDRNEWIGFHIRDTTSGRQVGPILDVIESAAQWTAVLEHEGKEVYIPLHEDLVVDLDPETQLLTMALPQGLFELFLED